MWALSFEYHAVQRLTLLFQDLLNTLSNGDVKSIEIIRLLFPQLLALAPDLNALFLFARDARIWKSRLFNLTVNLVGINEVTGPSIRYWDK